MTADSFVTPAAQVEADIVEALLAKAQAAQRIYNGYSQEQVDEVVTAAGWAIVQPARNRRLAELAVRETGLGNVEDKVLKNRRKTLGLLRDLQGAKSVGIIGRDPQRGLLELARAVGVVAALTPSTNPAATPANKIINALKGRNAIIVAPSPKGLGTCAALVAFVHAQLEKVGAPLDLVQYLPGPVSRRATQALMRGADLVLATGSRNNVGSAYASGTPAFGVGAGNVAVIIDSSADLAQAAHDIGRSKIFDNATSCSSENSVVILDAVYEAALAALGVAGGVLLDADEKRSLQASMWQDGRLVPAVTAQTAPVIAALAGLTRSAVTAAKFLMVEESGAGAAYPFSGEKLSPVLTVYRARDFDHACAIVAAIYDYQGAGHSVGIHSANDDHILRLGNELPVCRVIVNQAHCFATGGNFDNGLPFSLSMGCGTWGGNNFSDNLNYRHFLNISRIVRKIAPHPLAQGDSGADPEEALEERLFGPYLRRHG